MSDPKAIRLAIYVGARVPDSLLLGNSITFLAQMIPHWLTYKGCDVCTRDLS